LQFGVQQFRRVGMDPAGPGADQQMVRNGVTAFGTLSTSLDQVADSARKAGLNVGQAQQRFGQVLGAVQGR